MAGASAHHVLWGGTAAEAPESHSYSDSESNSAPGSHREAPAGSRATPHHVLHVPRSQASNMSNSYLQGYLAGVTIEVDSSGLSGSKPDFSHESGGGGGSLSAQRGRTKVGQAAPPAGTEEGTEDEGGDDSDSDAGDDGGGGLSRQVLGVSGPNDHMVMARALLRDEQGEIPGLSAYWSKGAKRHGDGRCKPCHYVHVTGGCVNGPACGFCHLPHPKTKPRQCKSKRVHYKEFQAIMDRVHRDWPERFRNAARLAAETNPALQAVLDNEQHEPAFATPATGTGSRRHILSL